MVLIEAVVDSGATNSVAKKGVFRGAVKPSAMSKAGKGYQGPDGGRIPNHGQTDVSFEPDEGHKCGLTFQIADVERPLIAVSHLSEAGNEVRLWKTGGEVTHLASGRKIKIQRKGGVYVMRMWVYPADKESDASASFPRPGRS